MSFLEAKIQTIWLITFGDLLTLLLCFFIALITLSGSDYHSFKEAAADMSSKSNLLRAGTEAPDSKLHLEKTGTLVAETKTETEPELVEVEDGNVSILELSLKEMQAAVPGIVLKEMLEKALSPYFYKDSLLAQSADVESCMEQGSSTEELAWSIAGARGLQMRRQLIDLGLAASAVRLRNLGPGCSRKGRGLSESSNKDAVLRVTIRFTRR